MSLDNRTDKSEEAVFFDNQHHAFRKLNECLMANNPTFFCRTPKDVRVQPARTATQLKQPYGEEMVQGILCAMLAASTTNYMGYVKVLTKIMHN